MPAKSVTNTRPPLMAGAPGMTFPTLMLKSGLHVD
jgi:hypothetical protein